MARGKGLARQAQQPRVENEEAPVCPLCIEPLDAHEQDWFPCACGYQVCAFCYQRLQLENNNQCPGCRTEYGTQAVAGQRSDAKAKATPVRRGGRGTENGLPSPARSPGSGQAAPGASPPGRRVRSADASKPAPLVLPLPAKQPQDRPGLASARTARGQAAAPEPPRAAPEPPDVALQQAAPAAAAAEERHGDAGPAAGRAPAWGVQPQAATGAAAGRPPPPSPTKWPELGVQLPAGSQPAASLPAAAAPPSPPRATRPPQPVPLPSRQPRRQAAAPLRKLPTELLWSLLLAPGAPPRDAKGAALRQSVQQAVQAGALSSREGAARLAAHLQAGAGGGSEPQAQPSQREALPNGGLQAGRQPEEAGSLWLQSGVAAALGLDLGPSPDKRRGGELWAQPQSAHGSGGGGGGGALWAGRRQDADAVPDALQELWANAVPSSNGPGAAHGSYGSYGRGSGDPLESLAGGRQQASNGLYASPYASTQMPPPAASRAVSQGVSAGLGLQPPSAYSQGMRSALDYGLPPGYASSQAPAGQPSWAQQYDTGSLGGQQQASWGLPEVQQAPGYGSAGGSQQGGSGLQPPPGWAGYQNGLGSRLYHQ